MENIFNLCDEKVKREFIEKHPLKEKSPAPEQACPVVVEPHVDCERSEAISDNDTQSAARIDCSRPETYKPSGKRYKCPLCDFETDDSGEMSRHFT